MNLRAYKLSGTYCHMTIIVNVQDKIMNECMGIYRRLEDLTEKLQALITVD